MTFKGEVLQAPKSVPGAAFQQVVVVGLGYIGLPTAAVLATAGGVSVVGIDVRPDVVETVNRGEIHIVEPMLDQTVRDAVGSGKLKASLIPVSADAFLIAVPTPINPDKTSDLSFVMSAGESVARALKPGDLVILESTSPVGSTERLIEQMSKVRPDLTFPKRGGDGSGIDVHVAYCPERVLPGKVVEELVANDRSIGGVTPACTERAIALYSLFVKGQLLATDVRSAELCKLAENAFRDVNIAYANELANVCERLEMNVWEVIRLANHHPRVNILQPGVGVGGHCIAVDPWFIAEAAPEDTPVIQASRRVNDGRHYRCFAQIDAAAKRFEADCGRRPIVALLGLSFKPNIDDLRESPAVELAEVALKEGVGEVWAVEPHIARLPEALSAHGLVLKSLEEACADADILAMLVDHQAFGQFAAMPPRDKIVLMFCRDPGRH